MFAEILQGNILAKFVFAKKILFAIEMLHHSRGGIMCSKTIGSQKHQIQASNIVWRPLHDHLKGP
jgi:hypothetical protein